MSRLVCAAALVLAGCSVQLPEPVAGPTASPLIEVQKFAPESESSTAVVLIPSLGVSPDVFSHPEGGMLAQALWSAGHAVYALRIHWEKAESFAEVVSALSATWHALTKSHERWYAVGHGWGGAALYEALAGDIALHGLVALGTPMTWGGSSRALRGVLDAPAEREVDTLRWSDLLERPVIASSNLDPSTEMMLLTHGWTDSMREAFYGQLEVPMAAGLLASVREQAGVEVPVPPQTLENLRKRPALPMLLIMAPADGMGPPHQSDPLPLGLTRDNLTRVFLTRVNGTDFEYNHLDLVFHPEAACDVSARVVDWIEEQQ